MKKRALRKDFYMEIKKSLNRFLSIMLIVALGVAFYSGIQSAAPDMRYSGDAYFDEHKLMDLKVVGTLGLTPEDVEAVSQVKGVEKAEPGYMLDVICGAQDKQIVLRLESISPTLNRLTPTEGRVPEKPGEVFVDIEFLDKTDYEIGDSITFYRESEEDLTLKQDTYTIVGAGSSPLYISFNRGNTTLGNGELAGAAYILPEDFDLEVYTQIYMSVSGAQNLTAYTDAYDTLIEKVQGRVEDISGQRCDIRYREVLDEANEKLADAEKELADGKAEGESELADAEKELTQGESELAEGKQELADAEKELADAREKLEDGRAQLAAGQQEIADNKALLSQKQQELESGKAKLADGWAQLSSGKKELEAQEKKFNAAKTELENGEKALAQAKEQAAAGRAQYEAGVKKYEEGKAQYEAGETAYAQGLAEYQKQEAVWPAQKSELENQKTALSAQRTELENQRAALETQKQTAVQKKTELDGVLAGLQTSQNDLIARQQAAQGTLDGLNGQIADVDSQIAGLNSQITGWKTELETWKGQEGDNSGEISRLEGLIADANVQITGLNQTRGGLFAQAETQNQTLSALSGELARVQTAIEETSAGISQAEAGIAQIDGGLAQINNGIAGIDGGIAQIDAGISEAENALAAGKQELDSNRALLDQSKQELDATPARLAQALAQVEAGEKKIASNEEILAAGREELKSGQKQISAAKKKIADSENQLNASQAQITDGENQIASGWQQIASAQAQLETARQEITDGEKELADGEKEIADGKKEIADGEKELADGRKEYEDGVKEFEEEIAEAEEKIADAKQEISEIEEPEWMVTDRSSLPENIGYGENADRIRAIGQVFPVLFFLVAALISLTTMTRMVEEERTQIGTLKALGYSKAAIAAKYLCYALAATLGGSIVGILLGEKFLPFVIVTAYRIMYHHMPNIVLPYNMKFAAFATGAALFSTLGATMAACYRELSAAPAVLMRPPAPKEGKRVLLERIPFLWKHFSFIWKSTIRNLFRYKKRFFMTIFGIGGCMALMIVGYGLRDSIQSIATLQYDELQSYEGMVILDEEASRQECLELAETIHGNSLVDDSMETLMQKEIVENPDSGKRWDIYMMVPEDPAQFETFTVFRDRISQKSHELTDKGAIITEKIANMMGVGVGDAIAIEDEELGSVEVPIAAITEHYMAHYIYLTPTLYEECFGQKADYNQVIYRMKEESREKAHEVGEEFLKSEAALSISYTDTLASQLDDMLKALDTVMIVLIVSAGLLAFVVLYNLNNININERKRELATIKVLGFYDGEVSAYVYRENILITIIGIFAGIAMGTVLHRFVITTVEVDAVMFGRVIKVSSFVISSVFTAAFSIFVNVVMHFKLKKIDMVESLKSVE